MAGNPLDGDWENPADLTDPASSLFPSGDGSASGSFRFRFNVLPGDVNGNGAVTTADVGFVRSRVGEPTTHLAALLADVNGNGAITTADVDLIRSRVGSVLPEGEPELPPAASSTESEVAAALPPIAYEKVDASVDDWFSDPAVADMRPGPRTPDDLTLDLAVLRRSVREIPASAQEVRDLMLALFYERPTSSGVELLLAVDPVLRPALEHHAIPKEHGPMMAEAPGSPHAAIQRQDSATDATDEVLRTVDQWRLGWIRMAIETQPESRPTEEGPEWLLPKKHLIRAATPL